MEIAQVLILGHSFYFMKHWILSLSDPKKGVWLIWDIQSLATLLIWAFLKMVLKENLCWEWRSLPSW